MPLKRRLIYGSTKTYKASLGLSTTFRQHKAKSHCRRTHGYALEFSATFEADTLDGNNWVVDFGALKSFKEWLVNQFDHTTLVAKDDPELSRYVDLAEHDLIDLRVVDGTGCEMVSRLVFSRLDEWLGEEGHAPRVRLVKLEVREHDGNSAYVRAEYE